MKIIKIPFSGGCLAKSKGTKDAPDRICSQLENIHSNEQGRECSFEIDSLDLNEHNISESHSIIEAKVQSLSGKSVLVGGDHSISYSSIKAFSAKNPDFQLIVFDAHPDLMKDFEIPTHESYLRNLIDEKIVPVNNIIMVGLRNWDKAELDLLLKKNIKYYTSKEIYEKGIKKIVLEISQIINKPIYLSIDIDVVDPAYAPGTGYTEPGGLSSRELLYIIQELNQNHKILMADIVEVDPSKDLNNMTSILSAKILSELL